MAVNLVAITATMADVILAGTAADIMVVCWAINMAAAIPAAMDTAWATTQAPWQSTTTSSKAIRVAPVVRLSARPDLRREQSLTRTTRIAARAIS